MESAGLNTRDDPNLLERALTNDRHPLLDTTRP